MRELHTLEALVNTLQYEGNRALMLCLNKYPVENSMWQVKECSSRAMLEYFMEQETDVLKLPVLPSSYAAQEGLLVWGCDYTSRQALEWLGDFFTLLLLRPESKPTDFENEAERLDSGDIRLVDELVMQLYLTSDKTAEFSEALPRNANKPINLGSLDSQSHEDRFASPNRSSDDGLSSDEEEEEA